MVQGIQEPIAPVNHSRASAAATTAAGAGVGAVKSGVKWGGTTFLACVVMGGLIGTGAIGLGAISWGLVTGLLGGAAAGALFGPIVGGFGAVFGGAKGGAEAHHQVKMEKATAQAMDMQLEAYKYNALAQAAQAGQNTTVYAPSASNYTLPPQGSAMNQAMPQIGGGVQYDGAINGQQLQRA